jgi:hypothetical protein
MEPIMSLLFPHQPVLLQGYSWGNSEANKSPDGHECGTVLFQSGVPRNLEGKVVDSFYSVLEVNHILAHYVIHDKCDWNILHVVRERLAYTVVHIYLPGIED